MKHKDDWVRSFRRVVEESAIELPSVDGDEETVVDGENGQNTRDLARQRWLEGLEEVEGDVSVEDAFDAGFDAGLRVSRGEDL